MRSILSVLTVVFLFVISSRAEADTDIHSQYRNIRAALSKGQCPRTLGKPEATWTRADLLGTMNVFRVPWPEIQAVGKRWDEVCRDNSPHPSRMSSTNPGHHTTAWRPGFSIIRDCECLHSAVNTYITEENPKEANDGF